MADTTSSVSPFNFGTHAVRVVLQDGVVWFVATDVAESLGYKSPKDAASYLDDDEKGSATVRTPGGDQKLTVINESGLYALVLRSRKPEARKFAKWVTSEVLPAIRKTGSYELPNLYKQQPGDKLSAEQQQALRQLLEENVKRLPHAEQAGAMIKGWSKLKAHFQVGYRDIPAERYTEAVSLITRHVVELSQPQPVQAPSLMNRRWLISFNHHGQEIAQPIDFDDCLLKYQDLPKLIAAPDNRVASTLLADIANACLQRLAHRAPQQAIPA